MKNIILAVLCGLTLATQAQSPKPTSLRVLFPAQGSEARQPLKFTPPDQSGTDVWLVKLKPGVNIDGTLASYGDTVKRSSMHAHVGLMRLETNRGKRHKELFDAIRGQVQYIQHEQRVQTCDTIPNDPMWSQQWDMAKMQMPTAWDKWRGSNVVVAIIDTGVDFNHPDLVGNLYTAPDGSHGWQCFRGVLQTGGMDDFGHGTHVAGTIGAVANNALGMAGINWQVKIMSFAFLDAGGSGQDSDAVLLIDKIIALKQAGLNIVADNCSWGGADEDQALQDAFNALENADILSCVAAGNSSLNNDIFVFSPATFTNRSLISVMASDQNDAKANFSDYGFLSVDIAAPGVGILSTMSTNAVALRSSTGYGFLAGTSMATPHVCGLAALVRSFNPRLNVFQARDLILNRGSYDPITDAGGIQTSTAGRINANKAINNPLLVTPKANNWPSITRSSPISDTRGGGQVSVTFSGLDPDGDPLRYACLDQSGFVPFTITNSASFTAPRFAIPVPFALTELCADGNGGAGTSNVFANILLDPNFKTNSYDIAFNFFTTNNCFRVDYLDNSTSNAPAYWKAYVLGVYGGLTFGGYQVGDGNCYGLGLGPGSWKVFVESINTELTRSRADGVVIRNNTTDTHPYPKIIARFDRTVGPAPLTVNYDFSGTTNATYFSYTGNAGGQGIPSIGQLTFSDPGIYDVEFYCFDPSGYGDYHNVIFSALAGSNTNQPPPPPPPPPPTNTLNQVTDLFVGASGGRAELRWTDRSTGEDRYEVAPFKKSKGSWLALVPIAIPANSSSYSYLPASGGFFRFQIRSASGTNVAPWSLQTPSVKL